MNKAVFVVVIFISAVVGANEHGLNINENIDVINNDIVGENPKESRLIYIQALPALDGNYHASRISIYNNGEKNLKNAEVNIITIKSRTHDEKTVDDEKSINHENYQKDNRDAELGTTTLVNDGDDDVVNTGDKNILDYPSKVLVGENESEIQEDEPTLISRRLDMVENGDDIEAVDIDNPMLEPEYDHQKKDINENFDDFDDFDQEIPTRRFMGQDLVIDLKGRRTGLWSPGLEVIRTPTGPANVLSESLYRPFPRFFSPFPFATQHATPPPMTFSYINPRDLLIPNYDHIFNRRLQGFENVMATAVAGAEETPTINPHANAYLFEPELEEDYVV